ncbi:MAG TPA: hypothetical protein VFG14_14645 [Chthoniobacteraceae bacterium]|nr:hypothetical protein [Chthoniobacteraceae bacterium]
MKDEPGFSAAFKLPTRENPNFGAAYSVFLAPKSEVVSPPLRQTDFLGSVTLRTGSGGHPADDTARF